MALKLKYAAAAVVAAAAGAAVWYWSGSGGAAPLTLTILHTNDFHSRIEPINRFNSRCSAEQNAEGACFGGWARMKTIVEARRAAANGPALLLDGGDQFQGSLFYTQYKGRVAAEMMVDLGYDAMAVGNHEFDDGPEALAAFAGRVGFPVLLTNADLSAAPALAAAVRKSAVIEIDEMSIGLLGVAPADTGEKAGAGPTVRFLPPEEALPPAVAELEAQGVDKIILLSHSGYAEDVRIAGLVAGLDVIVGGHSHTLLSNNPSAGGRGAYPTMAVGPAGDAVAIVQAFAYGRYLGELRVEFDEAGRLVSAGGEPILVDGAIEEDPAAAARVAALAEPLQALREQVVGEASAPIDGSAQRCRAEVCQMGVLVAEAMLARVANQGVQVAIMNGGGLKASIDAGPVTMGEILEVAPYQNTLATFEISGADLLAALENGVSDVENGSGRFPQVAGLRFDWSPEGNAEGGRILSAEIRGADGWGPIYPDLYYKVVTNNFVRGGGDGYAMFRDNARNIYDYGPNLEEVVADFLAEVGPYEPFIDERIRRM